MIQSTTVEIHLGYETVEIYKSGPQSTTVEIYLGYETNENERLIEDLQQ